MVSINRNILWAGALLLSLLTSPASATQTRFDISGLMVASDANCPSPVPVFDQDDCSYNASNPTGRVIAEWIGPLFNAGYYAPGVSPGPAIAGANDPVPGDGKTPPTISGTVDIDDQGTATGTDDTIAATIIIGQTVRNFGAGARGTAEETWTSLTMHIPAASSPSGTVTVSSAMPNASGGFDYVIGSQGMPPRLVDAATGTDIWPSESGADADPTVGVGHYWAAASPIGIAPIEDNARGMASIGTTASFTATGYSCDDGPPNNGDGIGGAASACDAKGRMGDGVNAGGRDFENILLSLSTDAAGNITAATLIWVQQQDVVAPAGDDSWVAGLMEFTGVSRNCGVAGIAGDDSYSVSHDSVDNSLDVGINDTNLQNPVTATICAAPDHGGEATIENSPGDPLAIIVRYTPAPGFLRGTETFQYTVDDGAVVATATVTIEVAFLVAEDDQANVIEGDAVDIDVTFNDHPGSGLLANHTVTITRQPNVGSVTLGAGNHITYTSVAGSHGNDNFEYTLTDEDGEISAPAMVQIGIGVARTPTPAGGVSSVDPWNLLLLAGVLVRRKIALRCTYPGRNRLIML